MCRTIAAAAAKLSLSAVHPVGTQSTGSPRLRNSSRPNRHATPVRHTGNRTHQPARLRRISLNGAISADAESVYPTKAAYRTTGTAVRPFVYCCLSILQTRRKSAHQDRVFDTQNSHPRRGRLLAIWGQIGIRSLFQFFHQIFQRAVHAFFKCGMGPHYAQHLLYRHFVGNCGT